MTSFDYSPAVQSSVDQITATLRDHYDRHGVNLHDNKIKIAVVTTANLLADARALNEPTYLWTLRGLIQLLELS